MTRSSSPLTFHVPHILINADSYYFCTYQVAPSNIESKASDVIVSLLSTRHSGSLAANHPEERKDDFYSNSMLEAICAGVEDGVDKHFVILSVKFVSKSTVNALQGTSDVGRM